MNPITRKEMFLAAAGGQDVETPTPVTREEAFLDAIAKGIGGGSSLPSTETASAGDVLSLDDNKDPQWATPSGGGGVLVVNITNGTSNKTWQAIWDAYASGAGCKFVENFDEYTTAEWYLATVKEERSSYIVELFTADINDSPASILPATLSCDSASGYPTGSLG